MKLLKTATGFNQTYPHPASTNGGEVAQLTGAKVLEMFRSQYTE